MKLSSLQIGLISVGLAIVLWLVATFFEDDARWVPEENRASFNTSVQSKRDDTPLKLDTDVMSCVQIETQLKSRVENAQRCVSDDDCTLFDYGYPVQCMTSVSKIEITALRLAYRTYEDSCAYRVYYDCPTGEMERVPVCQNNLCAVELQTLDPLQDATLQHLGIQDP